MENISRDKLIRLAIFILVLLMVVILLATVLYKKNVPSNENEAGDAYKKAILMNNDDRVIQYGNEVFYISNFRDSNMPSYVIASIPANFDEEPGIKSPSIVATKTVADARSKLFIYNNCLYYTHENSTYEYNLLDKKTRTFCDGILQYITSNFFVSLDKGDLYKGEYYPTTHAVKTLQALTANSNMNWLCEDDDTIFYEASATEAIKFVVGLDKNSYNLKIYYRYNVNEYKLSSVISNNNLLVLLVQSEKYVSNSSGTSNKPITLISINKKDLSKIENMLENKYQNGEISSISNGKKKVDICKLTTADGTIEKYELNFKNLKLTKYTAEEINGYEIKSENNEVVIFEGENEIGRFSSRLKNIDEVYMHDSYELGDYIYFDISVYDYPENISGEASATREYEFLFLRVNKENGKTYKINQKNIEVSE